MVGTNEFYLSTRTSLSAMETPWTSWSLSAWCVFSGVSDTEWYCAIHFFLLAINIHLANFKDCLYQTHKEPNYVVPHHLMTWSMVSLSLGSVLSIPRTRSLASSETPLHSGRGNSYLPSRIRRFMPGELARPWLLYWKYRVVK